MGRKRKKLMGPVAYYLWMKATSYQGKPALESRMGPYRTLKEAETKKREEEEARGKEGYEYEYRIEPVPTILLQADGSPKK